MSLLLEYTPDRQIVSIIRFYDSLDELARCYTKAPPVVPKKRFPIFCGVSAEYKKIIGQPPYKK